MARTDLRRATNHRSSNDHDDHYASGWISAAGDETWIYASADDPTFTFTIAGDRTGRYWPGMRLKLTQATGGTKYFIITAVAYSDPDTTVTIYGGTDDNLENEAITDTYYSTAKAPVGFPLDPTKWTVRVTDTSQRSQAAAVQNTWYNLGAVSITLPIGIWNVTYQVAAQFTHTTTAGTYTIETTLATVNNNQTDAEKTAWGAGGSVLTWSGTFTKSKVVSLAAKTVLYLNTRTTTAGGPGIYNQNGVSPLIIEAVCAYL